MFVSSVVATNSQVSMHGLERTWSLDVGKPKMHQSEAYLMLSDESIVNKISSWMGLVHGSENRSYVHSAHPTSVCPVS